MTSHPRYSVLSVALMGILLSGCNESTSSDAGADYGNQDNTTSDFDQKALIVNLVDGVITPTFEQFVSVSNQQISDISAYCSVAKAFEQDPSDNTELTQTSATAQQSWRNTMSVWQQAEMMQLGPLTFDDGALRNKIYSWPVTSRCGVDLDVVSFENNDINGTPYDIASRTPARKGMVALEYLLFNPSFEHSCTGNSTPAGWDNRTDDDRRVARCEFAVEAAKDINNNAQQLLIEWSGDNGYGASLKQAGEAGSSFATVHEAVNKLSDALFYIDSVTKDRKLAVPLGKFANICGSSVCPEDVESPLANHSIENISSNLEALSALFSGNEGLGFDDYLIDENDADTATALRERIATALANSRSYQTSLADTLVSDEEQVASTHDDVKAVTDKLKNEFINSLALELPQTSAGDND
ncbi:imelysin family protein [Shewanella sp. 1CM18E]|uniref:imelysin family protein n=1 Tax=Shewanella sp. 1CM18E TaxID=2929169 RepID=UPI0020BECFC1|nr:imelysin family protein [Shewanella sp. 1CM18E]MCK8044818.1 imelysin family protein [Shewanella sp. 1CM18E]